MAYLLLVLTPLFWAGNMVSVRAVADQSDPILLAFLRWVLAFALIAPWALPALYRQRRVLAAHLPVLLTLSMLSVAAFNTFIYIGVESTTATNAVLLQAIIPILILLIGRLFLNETIRSMQWLGILFSVLGVMVLVSQGELQRLLQLQINRGDLWILAAVISWSIYSVGLRYRPSGIQPFTFFAFSVLVGLFVLMPFAIWEQGGVELPSLSTEVLWVIVYIAIFPSILAYLFWNRAVAELGASVAGLFIYLIPVFGLFLAVIFLGEQIQIFHLVGIVSIVIGIWLAVFQQIVSQKREHSAKL